jgi:glucosamine-6-phosphate deaminase
MLVIIKGDYRDLSLEAARIVSASIRKNPAVRLGLPAGETPLGMYTELVRLHREENLDFSQVITFNLDEYVGVAPGDPRSYHYFMYTNFFGQVNLSESNIHIPDGTASDLECYCQSYEECIRAAGGIDLQILGIGTDGHIGFNEPTSSLASRTRVKTLTKTTIQKNRQFFTDDLPECAITMGIGTILDARQILLLASGVEKAPAVAHTLEGPITASVPASALQLHADVTVLIDEGAAGELRLREYYDRVLLTTSRYTPNRFR